MRELRMGVVGVIVPLALMMVGTVIGFMTDTADATIIDVNIAPSSPGILDEIRITTSGMEGSGPVFVTNSDFWMDENTLHLDLFLNVGSFQMVTPWSHSEDIGTLAGGMYDLYVQTIESGNITDDYTMTFEVLPEPATALTLALGAIGLRRRRQSNRW